MAGMLYRSGLLMSQCLYRLHPPRVSGESFEEGAVFPIGHKRPGECLLQQSYALERPVGELPPALLEPPLRRVHLFGLGEADVMGYSLGGGVALRTAI